MAMDLMQGTLDMLILKVLTWDDMHGYAIARWLERTTDDALRIEEGSLYPALHRMTRKGWIKAEWGVSENNRRARWYSLTALGRKQLRQETAEWGAFIAIVAKVMRHSPA